MKKIFKKIAKQIKKLNRQFTLLQEMYYNSNIDSNFKKEKIMNNNNQQPNIFDFAQFFINQEKTIDDIKIQCLLYYAQGYYIAKHNRVLFTDEIKAYPRSIVISSVHTETIKQEWQSRESGQVFLPGYDFSAEMSHLPLTKDQKTILKQVWDEFGHMNADQLQEKIINESPWQKTFDPNDFYAWNNIEPFTLYHFFINRQK